MGSRAIRWALGVSLAMTAVGLGSCSLWARSGLDPRPGTDTHNWYRGAELRQLLASQTHSREVAGNAVRLLVNGKSSFSRRHENLASAKFVLVKTFIWTDDDAGRRLADAIADRARAGVPVIVQYDVKGNLGGAEDIADMLSRVSPDLPVGEPQVIADLRKAGVYIVATNSPGRPLALKEWRDNALRFVKDARAATRRSMESMVLFDHCDHDKYFITVHESGEVRAILGGLNIASEYALGGVPHQKDSTSGRGGWRDTDIEVTGSAAHAIIDEFLRDLERHRGKAAPAKLVAQLRHLAGDRNARFGNVSVRLVVNNPLFDDSRTIDELYRLLILATPRTEPIFLSTPYFAPSKKLREALLTHMKGGGQVSVLTNSYETNDIDILTDAARYSARQLLKSEQFRLYERISRPDLGEHTLHHKIASFGDHGPVVIGSANLDAQSLVHNGEAVVVIQDSQLRGAFDAMVKTDTASDRAQHITRDQLNDAPLDERIRSFLAGSFAWYWL